MKFLFSAAFLATLPLTLNSAVAAGKDDERSAKLYARSTHTTTAAWRVQFASKKGSCVLPQGTALVVSKNGKSAYNVFTAVSGTCMAGDGIRLTPADMKYRMKPIVRA